MIEALGLRTGKQRVFSTHIMSNIAVLTRLGLFCETIRVFLLAVSREHPGLGEGIGDGLAQRSGVGYRMPSVNYDNADYERWRWHRYVRMVHTPG